MQSFQTNSEIDPSFPLQMKNENEEQKETNIKTKKANTNKTKTKSQSKSATNLFICCVEKKRTNEIKLNFSNKHQKKKKQNKNQNKNKKKKNKSIDLQNVSLNQEFSKNSQSIFTSYFHERLFPNSSNQLITEMPRKKILVLDLDETLVHSSFTKPTKYDFQFEAEIENYRHQVYVNIRPGLNEFFQKIKNNFEIMIFTAAQKNYANPVINFIDQEGIISKIFYRDSCVSFFGNPVKDLRVIGIDLDKIILVDNSLTSSLFQKENYLPIISWYGDQNDNELSKIALILERIVPLDNFFPILQNIQNEYQK
ncbi:ctd small phosphatase-like protein [Anaeramoeba ignava]|uniref:Ctd small phosphatase-like protein n=1 Tax=Anaeramoeba ignava TaxID=1746090 RepID=A0A9Q0R442_ANAIG|nr:ctd small phosphatase-like protein [Anaeramoeba ignava]